MALPNNFQCAECAAILREFWEAMPADFRNLKESCLVSGKELVELRDEMLASFAQDDSANWFTGHYPRTREARRRMAQHEALTGHSVFTHKLRIALSGPTF